METEGRGGIVTAARRTESPAEKAADLDDLCKKSYFTIQRKKKQKIKI
jgi:hypothetical protein